MAILDTIIDRTKNTMAADAEAVTLTLRDGGAAKSSKPRTPDLSLAVSVGVLLAGHLMFGANRSDVALELTLIYAVGFLCLRYLTDWGRKAASGWTGLTAPAVLFALVLLGAAQAMTPMAVGGPNPMWKFVPSAPAAAVLDRSAVIVEMLKLGGLACLFCTGALIGQEAERGRRFLHFFLIGSAIYVVWAFVSHLADPTTVLGVAKIFHRDRLTASFLSANTAATLLGFLGILVAGLLVERTRDAARKGARMENMVGPIAPTLIILLMILISVVLTASRAGLVATFVGLVAFGLWELFSQPWRRLSFKTWAALGAGLIVIVALVFASNLLMGRMVDLNADAAIRKELFDSHWRAFLASPLSGYGLGNFYAVNRLIENSTNYGELSYVRALHNVYIQWLEEGGIIAAFPMFACIAWILVSTALGAHRRQRMTVWMRALVCASLVILIHGATDYGLQVPSIAAMWACLLGLGFGLANAPRGQRG